MIVLPRAVKSLIVAALAQWPGVATAQNVNTVNCAGQTLSGNYADVIVTSLGCTLVGARVFGSVKAEVGGPLKLTNETTVVGSVEKKNGGDTVIEGGSKVTGGVKVENANQAGELIISGMNTVAGNVFAADMSGDVTVKDGATVGSTLFVNGGQNVNILNARIFPGGIGMQYSKDLKICNSEIGVNTAVVPPGAGGGGINMIESESLIINATECGSSTILGTVTVEKGTGSVQIIQAVLEAADLNVIEQVGDVEVTGTSLSDVKVEKSTGSITLVDVTTDSDTSVIDNGGDVTITNSAFGSDTAIILNDEGDVTITGTSFSQEDVRISQNGNVLFEANSQFGGVFIENTSVNFTLNNVTNVEISKNGGATIVGNAGESLKCADNPVSGSGNNFVLTECPGLS